MLPERYTLANLNRVLSKPSPLREELTNLRNAAIRIITAKRYRFEAGNGLDVFSDDWDNLILLDAARFDYFEEFKVIDGEMRKVSLRLATHLRLWSLCEPNKFLGYSLPPLIDRMSEEVRQIYQERRYSNRKSLLYTIGESVLDKDEWGLFRRLNPPVRGVER